MNEAKTQPPKWILKILRLFCPPQLFEEIEGDLIQRFDRNCKTIGVRRAQQSYFGALSDFSDLVSCLEIAHQ